MRNPHDDTISVDDYDAREFDDAPQGRPDPTPRSRHDDRDHEGPDDSYAEPKMELPQRNREQRRVDERELRAKGFTPQHREANGVELVGIDFDGWTYWFPADPESWTGRATRAFEDEKALTALEALLVPDEKGRTGYDRIEDMPMRKINELFQLFGKAGGYESSGN